MSNNKPIDYIICEGPSDAEFVSLYIETLLGYQEDRNQAARYVFSAIKSRFYYLVGPNRDALVCSCGGCNNIERMYNNVVLPEIKGRGIESRVIVMIDRDNKTDNECYNLVPFSEVSLIINNWINGSINGPFVSNGIPNTIRYRSYFSVIPATSSGAFENVLIVSIYNNEYDIANEVTAFFSSLSAPARIHINTSRREIKAKLDTMIVLIDPERIHSTLKDMFAVINLNDPNIVQNFSFLSDIVNNI